MPLLPRMATTGGALAAALLATATMQLPDKALAGSPVLTAGTKALVTPGASTPSHAPLNCCVRWECSPQVFR